MDDKNFSIPYIVYEGAEAASERTIKRLIIALVITIVLMVGTNVFWIYEFCSFDYTTEETSVEADNSSTANYIGQDGDITYGGENNGEEEITDTE